MAFALRSPAFRDGDRIPDRHARKGDNVSPPLEWQDAPPGTRSFALFVEDPDAPLGMFRHWAVYNIPAEHDRLPENTRAGAKTDSLDHGVNDFGHPHYDGPQPPKGHGVHHYHFRLAALDVTRLQLPPTASVEEIWKAAVPHVIGEAGLVGTYETR
jgi:Raf kinase inhibitor-like YbhB/YbcL family protein